MTFYNPNVQSFYESAQPDYSALKGQTFACIDFVFSSPGIDNRQYAVSLNDLLLKNYLGDELSDLLSEMVYRSWQGSIVTPADFIQRINETSTDKTKNDNFYLIHLVKMLVEKLLLEPSSPLSPGKLNLYELIYPAQTADKEQVKFSLYERLKLIDYLISHLHFHPDAKQMHSQLNKHYIKVIVRTE